MNLTPPREQLMQISNEDFVSLYIEFSLVPCNIALIRHIHHTLGLVF